MLAALKCVIRWLIKSGYEIDPSVLKVRQSVKSKYNIVTLSESEIQQIKSGQRFSDMQQLSQDQIQDHMWIFQLIKTGKLMHVPLVGWSAEGLPRWDLLLYDTDI